METNEKEISYEIGLEDIKFDITNLIIKKIKCKSIIVEIPCELKYTVKEINLSEQNLN